MEAPASDPRGRCGKLRPFRRDLGARSCGYRRSRGWAGSCGSRSVDICMIPASHYMAREYSRASDASRNSLELTPRLVLGAQHTSAGIARQIASTPPSSCTCGGVRAKVTSRHTGDPSHQFSCLSIIESRACFGLRTCALPSLHVSLRSTHGARPIVFALSSDARSSPRPHLGVKVMR